jgi:hypothetical protein
VNWSCSYAVLSSGHWNALVFWVSPRPHFLLEIQVDAMVLMMQGHVLDALVTRDALVISEFPWNIWHFIRGFTAPTFLMVSGAVHAFATKRGEAGEVRDDVIAKRIRWALTIVGIGYFMMFPAGSVWELAFVTDTTWRSFFAVNILQLTGATMLLFVFLMVGTRSVEQMGRRSLWMAGGILVLTPLMRAVGESSALPLWLNSYVNDATGSLFPIFPYSAYLFAGLAVGARLHALPKERRDAAMKQYAWKIGGILVVLSSIATLLLASIGVSHEELEGTMSITVFLRRTGVVLMFFSLAVIILERTWSMRETWAMFGMKSLYIYVIHLVLLFGTALWSGPGRTQYRQMPLADGILYAVVIVGGTLLIAWLLDRTTKQGWFKENKSKLQILSLGALLYILLI